MASAHEQGSEDVAQLYNLQDFSVLPYAVHDHVTSRYSRRDRSRRQQPQRLLQVTGDEGVM